METLTIVPSKSGLPTARAGGVYLHSSYDPEKEAARFSASAGKFPHGSIVLILGEALGYLARRLLADNPGIRVLAALCPAEPAGGRDTDNVVSWRPGTGESFTAFLAANIPETDFPALRVLEWEPASRAYGDFMARLKEELSRFGRQVNGSLLTTAAFGKKWITNSIRNYLALEEALVLRKLSGPVCVAASGPSLPTALPFLRRRRRAVSLFALPSAADFLAENGIRPDGIVLTDPGFYAGLHFQSLARRMASGGPALFMPLSAYCGLHGKGFPAALFHQGMPQEGFLLEGERPFPGYVPANGTVAGSAAQMALSFAASPLILLGLDMAARGIEEHARHGAFDAYYTHKARRLRPEEGWRAARVFDMYPEKLSGAWRSSPALRTYAGWFSSRAAAWEGRVLRITDSPVDTGCPSSWSEAEKLLGESPRMDFEKLTLPPPARRREKAAAFIDMLEKDLLSPGELAAMIDMAGVLELRKNPGNAEARERILRAGREFCAAARSLVEAAQ
ncbi:MAG: DUF115 domain-containing protein [Spirochaetaceae bacterium]|nr:DUF115 domain-containing protein [Spirochaetaceae bacterium]